MHQSAADQKQVIDDQFIVCRVWGAGKVSVTSLAEKLSADERIRIWKSVSILNSYFAVQNNRSAMIVIDFKNLN